MMYIYNPRTLTLTRSQLQPAKQTVTCIHMQPQQQQHRVDDHVKVMSPGGLFRVVATSSPGFRTCFLE